MSISYKTQTKAKPDQVKVKVETRKQKIYQKTKIWSWDEYLHKSRAPLAALETELTFKNKATATSWTTTLDRDRYGDMVEMKMEMVGIVPSTGQFRNLCKCICGGPWTWNAMICQSRKIGIQLSSGCWANELASECVSSIEYSVASIEYWRES